MDNNINKKITTPILFLVFNRPDTTELVFEEIRKVKPRKLYLAADGPRLDKPGEVEKYKAVRKIISQVDWDCEIKTLFRKKNLGCKTAVSQAISWFFKSEDLGIILEDDCLPSRSFFFFCQDLLEKYKNNDQVFIISGNSFNKKKIGPADYYFSRIPNVWGWATWKRVWENYELTMPSFAKFKQEKKIKELWSRKIDQNYWLDIFDRTKKNEINSWAYPLTYYVFTNQGLCVNPNQNLVSNIGFGNSFTNTLISHKEFSNLSISELEFPLKHLDLISYSEKNDLHKNKINLKNYYLKKILRRLGLFNLLKKIYIKIQKSAKNNSI